MQGIKGHRNAVARVKNYIHFLIENATLIVQEPDKNNNAYKVVWLDLKAKLLLKEGPFRLAEKEGAIQYGYRELGTHARVLSRTLAHGKSKNEIR